LPLCTSDSVTTETGYALLLTSHRLVGAKETCCIEPPVPESRLSLASCPLSGDFVSENETAGSPRVEAMHYARLPDTSIHAGSRWANAVSRSVRLLPLPFSAMCEPARESCKSHSAKSNRRLA
jgi:hypothetical protein